MLSRILHVAVSFLMLHIECLACVLVILCCIGFLISIILLISKHALPRVVAVF